MCQGKGLSGRGRTSLAVALRVGARGLFSHSTRNVASKGHWVMMPTASLPLCSLPRGLSPSSTPASSMSTTRTTFISTEGSCSAFLSENTFILVPFVIKSIDDPRPPKKEIIITLPLTRSTYHFGMFPSGLACLCVNSQK